jgi:hypothetical protein
MSGAQAWNRSKEHQRAMARLLAPLVAATRPREFVSAAAATDQVIAFLVSLADVPAPVVASAVDRMLQRGAVWMPKPGELRAECASVRAAARRRAYLDSLPAECPTCGRAKDDTGPRWKTIAVNGVERVTRCDCVVVAQQAALRVGEPIALPPSREDVREQQESLA